MAKKRVKPLGGRVITLEYNSKLLKGNPLGDPYVRQLDIWLPPGYDEGKSKGLGKRYPVLFDLVGYTGSGKSHTNWRNFDENVPERAARLVHEKKMGECIIVFPDCFTALGGNQYINSSALGPYAHYLTKELVPFVDKELRTLATRDHRGCFGKSSGGYGAMLHGMKYSKYWGAIANHSGDAYFDFIYRCDWPSVLDCLSSHRRRKRKSGVIEGSREERNCAIGFDDGRVSRFLRYVWSTNKLTNSEILSLMMVAMAASYDPDPKAPNGFRLPFNLETGEIIAERWQEWLKSDPINLVSRYKKNLNSLNGIFIDCGWHDQYRIHYGTRILSKRLVKAGIRHRYEEFPDTHSGIDYRMDRSLPFLYQSVK